MLFKSKQYNSKDLYVVCLCKYTTHNHNGHISTDAKIIDFYIAKGYGKFFSIITKNGYEAESVENATFNNTYGIEEYFPLPLYSKNLPDKVTYKQIESMEKSVQSYFRNHYDITKTYTIHSCDCEHSADYDYSLDDYNEDDDLGYNM